MPCGLASSVSPSAEADWRRPDVLDLSDHQQRIVDAKINAVIAAQLRIIQPGPGSIPIEDRCGYCTIVSQIGTQAGAQRRQRRRSATGQIDRRDGRSAHRGVGKHIGIFGVDELGIGGELSSPQRQRVSPLLLEPDLVQSHRRQRLDAAHHQKFCRLLQESPSP